MTSVITSGSFISNGAALKIAIIPEFDKFELFNITDIGSAAAATPVMKATYTSLMTSGQAYVSTKTNGAATIDLENTILTNGFTKFDDAIQTPEAPKTGTAITAANPAVVTINGHGYNVGDRVRLYNTTGMHQIAGMVFTVTAVGGANSFTISLDASGFAAAATAVTARRLPNNPLFTPHDYYIMAITQANPGVISLSQATTGYEIGDYITINIPVGFGMTQLNGVTAKITNVAVDGTNGATLLTINVDTSAFTAFAFPVSAAVPFSFAQITPSAEIATKITNPERNAGERGIIVGTSVQTTAKLYQWFAYSTFAD